MRKSIDNKDLVALADKGKAKYKDGGKPEVLVPVQESFKEMKAAIQKLTSELGTDVSSGNKAILESCKVIIDSMNMYHEAVILTLENLPQPKDVDLSKVDTMHNMMMKILTEVTAEKPEREWDFDIKYDWKGDFDKIIAKEIKH